MMKLIILAGGCGARLFPLSREGYPKQFLKIEEEKSLLQKSIERFQNFLKPKDILVVTGVKYHHLVREQINEIGYGEAHVLKEPTAKNTAPAIALAVKYCEEKMDLEQNEVLFVAPADHIIEPKEAFMKKVVHCESYAKEGSLVTMGIIPTKPETGYGYIKGGEPIQNGFLVESFVEKPQLEIAKKFLTEGNYFWNSGMFAFTQDTILGEFRDHYHELYHAITQYSLEEFLNHFKTLTSISIDNAIAEKSKNVKMISLDLYWNDIGSWDSVFEYYQGEPLGNVTKGDCVAHDCENSMLLSNSRLVVGIGLSDTYIIETDDVVLAVKKGETQKIKQVIEGLKGREEVQVAKRVIKPWGAYTVLAEEDGYKVKKIQVNPGQRLSLQSHKHRNEHWVVVKGEATVVIGEKESKVKVNQGVYIPKTVKHRLSNDGSEVMELIETQQGEYTGEDDIIRYEDIYNRVEN
jgi:mannose-1-phosphate guanylyltransferase / mannose-6-phosphate isomerase